MDALVDALRAMRLSGGIYLDARFTAPWCVRSNLRPEDCSPFLDMPSQLIGYHVVLSGTALVWIEGDTPIEVNAGEIVLLPRNDPHMLGTATDVGAIAAKQLMQLSDDGGLKKIRHGGGGSETVIVCGFLGTTGMPSPLIANLPRLLKVDIRAATSRDWIEASVRFAGNELTSGRPPSPVVASRLSELLLIEAVRSYSETHEGEDMSWLIGFNDPQIGRALSLIHDDVAAPWSIEGLAKAAALSRTAFIDRFTALVGMPPIRYLSHWRLQTARTALRGGGQSVAQTAHNVGYGSEEAFSRAFKREFGISPALWRDRGLN